QLIVATVLNSTVTDQASVEETTKPHAPTIRPRRSIDHDTLLDNQLISSYALNARGAFKSLEDSLRQTSGTHLGFKRSASRPPTSFRHNTSKVVTSSSAYVLLVKHHNVFAFMKLTYRSRLRRRG
ncbi:hypothetical protein FRC03_010035, partial [Tulasnella sp. 419]